MTAPLLRPTRTARLFLEPLEDRSLLSADFLATQLLLTTTAGQTHTIKLDEGASLPDALAGYQSQAGILSAEVDHIVSVDATPDDTSFSSLWGLHNTAQTGGLVDADIDAPEAWNIHTGSTRITVAVIDTGIDYTHPDLYLNVWINQDELPGGHGAIDIDTDGRITFWDLNHAANAGLVNDANANGRIDGYDLLRDARWANGVDNDGNGKIDDLIGWDFVNEDNDPFDDNNHGTHVAGTIGAIGNNALTVVGVNWKVQIAGLKFLNRYGSGYTSDAVEALNYAVAEGIPISNNSWGGGGYSATLAAAIDNARAHGHLFVAAAGNSARNNDVSANYPSNYNYDNVLAVAATDSRDRLASFSNYGFGTVDLAAPGVSILSTTPNGYAFYSGTSMATPHVAGVAALLWSHESGLTYNEVIARILNNVDPVAGLAGKVVSGGRLNAYRTLTGSMDDTTAPRVLSAVPNDTTAVTSVRVTFSEAMNPLSFTVADIAGFTGPLGAIAATGVQAVAGSNNTQFDVFFAPQSATGSYRFDIGPDITDAAGNRMDQDGDTIPGQVGDSYRATFNIDPSWTFSNVTPVAIRDWRISSSTITINADLTISDLNVRLNIAHTYDRDLLVWLRAPDGTWAELTRFRGGSGDNFTNTLFDDEALLRIRDGKAPFAGSFRPEWSLTAFDGKNARGTWTLYVYDGFWRDQGTLKSWSLVISSNMGGTARTASFEDSGPASLAPQLPVMLPAPALAVAAPLLPPAGLPTERLGALALFLAREQMALGTLPSATITENHVMRTNQIPSTAGVEEEAAAWMDAVIIDPMERSSDHGEQEEATAECHLEPEVQTAEEVCLEL